MKTFIFLLAVAVASAQPWWTVTPYTGYHGVLPYTMPLVKPVEYKPEEYTKTFEYKNAMPEYINPFFGYPYHKITKMPELITDYAEKGNYEAVAAGGVVHKAKRSANPYMVYNHLPYTTGMIHPYTTYTTMPYHTTAFPYAHYPYYMPFKPIEPKPIVADDRMKEGTPDYASKGEYEAVSAGVVHKAKRSANPYLLYNNILPYTTYNTAAYTPYTYTAGFPYYNTYNMYNRFWY